MMSTADVLQSPQKLSSQQLRKIKKPIIEKRRRERINESLNQLKALVLEALNKDESQYNKMEKADILEMTVKHLKNLQSRLSKSLMTSQTSIVNRYKVGYQECAEEVTRYLNSVPNVHPQVKNHLGEHLTNCAHQGTATGRVNNLKTEEAHRPAHTPDTTPLTTFQGTPTVNSMQGQVVSGIQVGVPVTMNGNQPVMLSAGAISPVSSTQNFVPVIISPNSNVSVIASNPHSQSHQQQFQTRPLPGGVIPLYSHTSSGRSHNSTPPSALSPVSSINSDTDTRLYDSPRLQPSPNQAGISPSSPFKAEEAPVMRYSPSPEVSSTRINLIQTYGVDCVKRNQPGMKESSFRSNKEYCTLKEVRCSWSDYAKELHKYEREQQLVQCQGVSDVWRPW